MKFSNYEESISDTVLSYLKEENSSTNSHEENKYDDKLKKIFLILGLNEEIVESFSAFRKNILPGNFSFKDYDIEHEKEELGDVIWYITVLAKSFDISFNDLAKDNLEKVYSMYDKGKIELEKEIDFNKYQELSIKTLRPELKDNKNKCLLVASLGLSAENGVISSKINDNFLYNKPINKHVISEKLGDMLWDCSLICTTLGIDLEDVAKNNIEKAKGRYNEKGEVRESEIDYQI